MTVYELINPSDPYTLVSDSPVVAHAATLLLGEGAYALEPVSDDGDGLPMPLFRLCPDRALDWFLETHKVRYEEFLLLHRPEIAGCLRSLLIGTPAERASYEKGLELIQGDEARRAWSAHWHDERRSSLSDIGRRALALVEAIKGRESAGSGGVPR